MQEFLPFIVIGLATGAVYGLAGIGLVLTYKTSGIFNFGYGAIAALVAFCFYFLNSRGLPWGVSAAISLLVFAPILGLILELVARTLSGAGETIKVVATVGLILIVESLGSLWYPTYPPTFPNFLPQSTVRMLGVNVTWEQIILFLFSAVAAAALYWFFRSARSGIVMRGVVDNADLVAMSGDDPVLVRRRACIYEVLARFVARGVSLVIVEQYVQRALALANTVYILSRGKVIHVGKADELDPHEIYQRYLGIES